VLFRSAVELEVELRGEAEGGLLLFYDEKLSCGLGAAAGALNAYKHGGRNGYPSPGPAPGRRFGVRVVNDEDVASFFVRPEGGAWRLAISFEVSGYNHNMGDGFVSLRPALFAAGDGEVVFRSLRYAAGT
jgi:xylan 1,4-beta-xylosidase